MLDISL